MKTTEAQTALANLISRVGVVRKWLVALCVLRIAAAGLVFAMVYVGGYAFADHYMHFGGRGRVAALAGLLAGFAVLLFVLIRSLRSHVTSSAAARHIEARLDLGQELQSAIEYYESGKDYPYSKALAEYLIVDVERSSAQTRFDRTVPKWQASLSGAVIAAGVIVATLFVHGNYVFFSTYLARLTRPLANVAPMPATTLVAITKDILVEQGARLAMEAEIHGRVPDSGRLELRFDSSGALVESTRPSIEPMEVFPVASVDKLPRLVAEPTLEVGTYLYRFTAGEATTDWYRARIATIPRVKSITADVALPRSTVVKPYTAAVKDYSLSVLKGSNVTLSVEATEGLSKAVVTGLDGNATTSELGGGTTFKAEFRATRAGKMQFVMEGASGMANDKIPPLEIEVKINEPPQMTLVSPGGNLFVTNVSSVPISYEVTDDFGLKSAAIKLEIVGTAPKVFDIAVEEGSTTAKGAFTLELEDYPLSVGDSILLYADAADVDVGTEEPSRAASYKSEMTFIEVRPYRMKWVQGQMQPPKPSQQGDLSELRESLLLILEYTRAILSKTWALSNQQTLSGDDLAKVSSIRGDVLHCASELGKHESDPKNAFIAERLADCIENYNRAAQYLAVRNPRSAVDPEKQAYQQLRKLVEEIYKICPPGGIPPEMRDRLLVDDNVHLKRYDNERVAEEIRQIAQELGQAADEQDALRESFSHFLKENRKPDYQQATTDEKSWQDPDQPNSPGAPPTGTPGKLPPGRGSVEGSQQTASAPSSATGSRSAGATGRKATPAETMQMLQAKERALQQEVTGLKEALESLPRPEEKDLASARARAEAAKLDNARLAAQGEIESAVSNMTSAQDSVSRLYGQGTSDDKTAREASKALASAAEHLDKAKEALTGYFEGKDVKDDNLAMADELTKLADAYERDPSAVNEAQLKEGVAKAESKLTEAGKSPTLSPSPPTPGDPGQTPGSSSARGSSGNGGAPGFANQAVEDYKGQGPAIAARFLAMKFWTMSIEARKQPSKVSQEEPSNAELHKVENTFFEEAARYPKGSGGK